MLQGPTGGTSIDHGRRVDAGGGKAVGGQVSLPTWAQARGSALSRSLSPALVAEYRTRLPDRELLRAKLHEFYALTGPETT